MQTERIIPLGAAVTVANYTCSESHVSYVGPFFPLKEPNKIALGTKTAYANIDAEMIIEWMETYKYLGVDKVLTYYMESINSDAFDVLQYYASTGILDLFYYEPANEGKMDHVNQKSVCKHAQNAHIQIQIRACAKYHHLIHS